MRPMIAGNWKMHGLSAQLQAIEAVGASVDRSNPRCDVLICTPATLIDRAASMAAGRISIGGEDCSSEVEGAFTGDVSGAMLKDAGASAVIVGHSERRSQYGETSAITAAKAQAAVRAGLLAIICIGETGSQRTAHRTFRVCDDQINVSVPPDIDAAMIAVAHEPIWAIGSGHTPSLQEILDVHSHIREAVVCHLGDAGRTVRLLYGGSVDPENAEPILALANVDGALVGGASLTAPSFLSIIGANI